MPAEHGYTALHRLAALGRELRGQRGPDRCPRPTGSAPSLDELRHRRDEIEKLAARQGAGNVRVFGSVARREAGSGSDLDLLLEMGDRRSLLEQAALQGELEDLFGCPVDVVTTGGLSYAREETRERIEREVVSL